jgi:hypothetical protein
MPRCRIFQQSPRPGSAGPDAVAIAPRHRLAAAVAAGLILAGATIAIIDASNSDNGRKAAAATATGQVVVAAHYLGLSAERVREALLHGQTLAQLAGTTPGRSSSGLIDALVSSRIAALKAAVAAGTLAPAVERERLASLHGRMAAEVNLPLHASSTPQLDVAAHYLGTTATSLRAELRSGRTLAQIADASSGRSATGLIDALIASGKSRLDAAVAGGRLTRARAQKLLATLRRRTTSQVNRHLAPGA